MTVAEAEAVVVAVVAVSVMGVGDEDANDANAEAPTSCVSSTIIIGEAGERRLLGGVPVVLPSPPKSSSSIDITDDVLGLIRIEGGE